MHVQYGLKGKGKGSPYNRLLRPLERVEVQGYLGTEDKGGGSAPRSGRFTPGKDPAPIVQEDGWTPEPVWTGAENLALTGIRSPDRPAPCESLYRLSYSSPHSMVYSLFIILSGF